ncbi:hypothetical protein PAMC26577_17925 [Caballeronia sordidicola]|uniref:Uncharacterized protein n=1 Tax=Caballeronia sordidicola TaxID=196367 RepID=A0A242MRC9_CABSO|nr:hypothetical protein PAMC26577_17925 [Caballeronia sordidicola]
MDALHNERTPDTVHSNLANCFDKPARHDPMMCGKSPRKRAWNHSLAAKASILR